MTHAWQGAEKMLCGHGLEAAELAFSETCYSESVFRSQHDKVNTHLCKDTLHKSRVSAKGQNINF